MPNLNYKNEPSYEPNEPNCVENEPNHEPNEPDRSENEPNHEPDLGIKEDAFKLNFSDGDNAMILYLSKKEKQILVIIKDDVKISQKKLSIRTGLSLSTIKRILKSLQQNKCIERVGGTRGRWKILIDIHSSD